MGQARGSGSGNWGGGEDVGEDAIGVEAFQFGLGLEAYAVSEYGWYSAFDVVGDEVGAVFEGGYGLGDTHEAKGCAGAGAEGESGPFAGAADEVKDVGEQFGLDADGVDLKACGSK